MGEDREEKGVGVGSCCREVRGDKEGRHQQGGAWGMGVKKVGRRSRKNRCNRGTRVGAGRAKWEG